MRAPHGREGIPPRTGGCHTNPAWVEVAGQPARSPEDARYFVRWMDRVIANAAARDDYNDEAERHATLEYLTAARRMFEEKARGE